MKLQKISKKDVLRFAVLGVLVFVLVACQTVNTNETQSSPVTPTPMPSPTATATITPVPPTPTPAVQSIIDINAWRVQVRDEAMKAAGVNTWSEFIQKEVVEGEGFSVFESSRKDVGEPFTHIYVEGKVMKEPIWVEVKSEYLKNMGINRALVVPIAFEHTQSNDPSNVLYTEGPTIGLCGFETNEGFVATLGSYVDAGGALDASKHHSLTSPDDYLTLMGKVIMFDVIQQSRRKSFEGLADPLMAWQLQDPGSILKWNTMTETQKRVIAAVAVSPDDYLWQRALDETIGNSPKGWEHYGSDTKYGIGSLTYAVTTRAGEKWVLIVTAADDISAFWGGQ